MRYQRVAPAGDALLNPYVLLAIAVLIVNDHVLKAASPGWWTGKLSDFAGALFFPLLLQAGAELAALVAGKYRGPSRWVLLGGIVITAALFVITELSPAGAGLVDDAASLWDPPLPGSPHLTPDVGDLAALVMLVPAYRIGMSRVARPIETKRDARSRSLKWVSWAGGILILSAATTAAASGASARDPSDVAGRLDIKRISAPTNNARGPIPHMASTYERWRSRILARKATDLSFWISVKGDASPERVIHVGHADGRLRATMYRYKDHGDGALVTRLGEVASERPTRRSVSVEVPRRWIKRQGGSYRWSVSSYFWQAKNRRCSREYVCEDDAPNDRMLRGRA